MTDTPIPVDQNAPVPAEVPAPARDADRPGVPSETTAPSTPPASQPAEWPEATAATAPVVASEGTAEEPSGVETDVPRPSDVPTTSDEVDGPTAVGDRVSPDTTDNDDDGDGGDDGDGDSNGKKKRGSLLTRQIQIEPRQVLMGLAVLGVLVLAFGAYQVGQRQARSDSPGATTAPSAAGPTKIPKDYTTFNDKDTGVKLSVPRDWTALSTKGLDPAIRLAVGIPDTNDTIVLRVNAYSSEVTAANVGDQKNVFDQLLGGENITILVNQATTLRGMPALFYVYRFTDQVSGKSGIHAHYFVFQGKKMVSMIFQALPEDRYAIDAPVFDTIANSLVVAPGPPPAFLQQLGGTSTTAAGATTVPGTAPGASTVPSTSPATTAGGAPPTSR